MPASRRRSRAKQIGRRTYDETLERWFRGEATDEEASCWLWELQYVYNFADLTAEEMERVDAYRERRREADEARWQRYLQCHQNEPARSG